MSSIKRRYRCVIYTRKSTQDGLEQEFNSLDAQREACEAYVASQKSEGWMLLPKPYDDGGISGGHMDRPGLRSMMEDIKAGRVDVVVVYKVDRLTRSLSDFARLVEVFDAHDVSFVSVTQQFNTTSSMGRLTLNVLLSFAQFEREVTAERIRDKIAASKRKGKWMGGNVPLGYDNIDKKLVVNTSEAETVRSLYQLYGHYGTVGQVKSEADRLGLITKYRPHNTPKMQGGLPFSYGHLYQLLANPVYVGEIRHGKEIYPGEHEAIIDRDLWDKVQHQLRSNSAAHRSPRNQMGKHMLTGLIYDQTGDRLSPTQCNKRGQIYRYYTSSRLIRRKKTSVEGWRLPADHFETVIVSSLITFFKDQKSVVEKLIDLRAGSTEIQHLLTQASALADWLQAAAYTEQRDILQEIIHRIDLTTEEMTISMSLENVTAQLSEGTIGHTVDGLQDDLDEPIRPTHDIGSTITSVPDTGGHDTSVHDTVVHLTIPAQLKRRGSETKLILGGYTPSLNPYPNLIKMIARAHVWYHQLSTGSVNSVHQIAEQEKCDASEVSRIMPLAFLAPDLVTAILEGRQPVDLTADRLKRLSGGLPVCWRQQKTALGFSD